MKIIDINNSERECKKVYPDPKFSGYMRVQFNRHHEWYTISEFLKFNPNLEHLTKSAVIQAEDIAGIVSSTTKNTLKDTSQKWSKNAYKDFFVWISRGKGEGQKRTVTKNNANTAFIDTPWDTKPNTSSQYVLSHNIHKVKAMGNTLPGDEMKKFEKMAEKISIKKGVKPAPKQYTKKPKSAKKNKK